MDPNQKLYHLEHCENLPVTAAEVYIATETQADPVLSKAYQLTLQGWRGRVIPAYNRMNKLGRMFIVGNYRVVIPPKLRPRVLEEGSCRCKLNEGFGQKFCMVAKFGHYIGGHM